jgi:opacity protein-like surface antigen
MKKSIFVFFVFFFLMIGLTAQVRLGLNGGYAMPSNSNYKGGIAMGFQLGIGFGEHFALEIGVSSFKGDVVGSADGLSAGSLSRMPIEASLQARFPLAGKKLVPYIFAGGGYSLNKFNLDSSVSEPWTALGITLAEKVDNSTAIHAGAGLDFFVTEKLALNLNFKYLLSSTSGSWSQTDTGTGAALSGTLSSLSLNTLFVNFGLKYSF